MFKPSTTRLALLAVTGLLCGRLSAQTWDPAMKPGTALTASYPTGLGPLSSASGLNLQTIMESDYHRLGWQYNLFYMQVPLAWNITKGASNIVVDIADQTNEFPTGFTPNGTPDPIAAYVLDPAHPDVPWRKFGAVPGSTSDGNFLWISTEYRNQNNTLATQSNGNGTAGSRLIGKNQHGFTAMSMAVARENSLGMVGIAPNASAIATDRTADDPTLIDTDGNSANGIVQVPDVVGCIFTGVPLWTSFAPEEKTVKSGSVILAGVGNGLLEGAGTQTPTQTVDCSTGGLQANQWIKLAPRLIAPAKTSFSEFPGKVMAVGIVKDGLEVGSNVSLCGKSYLDGTGLRYPDHMNYSPTAGKFTETGGFNQTAFIDVVVPENEVAAHFAWENNNYVLSQKYRQGDAATSRAVGQLAGVVALMRSVDRNLGVIITDPNDKSAIHRKAYDIITFTAKKIPDQFRNTTFGGSNNTTYVLPGNPCWKDIGTMNFSSPLDANSAVIANVQIGYAPDQEQDNPDKLKRTWAQRMGFGMVDAYRAVAHSIPVKANYIYQQSTALSSGHLLNGRNYVHFGSRVNESLDLAFDRNGGGLTNTELNVLEWGGTSIPNEIHNNQGVTRIEGSNQTIVITIPQNYVAAIDGIVKTANSSTDRSIVTSAASGSANDHGLILASGMLDGVNLKGRVKIGDLLVNPVSANATGITVQNHGAVNDPASRVGSEIFGAVTLKKNAALVVDNNATLTLQPGAVVDMQGTQDITVKNGGTLIMEYPSAIKGLETRRLVVESGGTVIVRTKPSAEKIWKTELLTRVDIADGAQLIAEEGAFYKLKAIDVKTGGTWDCRKGSHTVLVSGGNMFGKWYVQGEAGKEAMVTGDVDLCGNVTGKALISALGVMSVSSQYDISKKKLSFNRAIFDNVRINARNMNVDPIEHCQFRSHRAIFGKREMLKFIYTGSASLSGMFPSVENITVRYCTFLDRKGDMEIEDDDQWRGNDKYHVTGLAVRGMKNVTVEQSSFNSLMHSINSYRCSKVLVSKNTFEFANAAVHDDGSAVTFCDNTCKKTEFTNGYNFSRASVTVDNTYSTISSSLFSVSTAQQFMRNNTLSDFRQGVHTAGSPIIMNPYRPLDVTCPWNGSSVYLNGYNHFYAENPSVVGAEFVPVENRSGKIVITRDQAEQRDIHLESNSMLEVYKGYNRFSLESGNHLYKEALPQIAVNINYNQWLDPDLGYEVRNTAFIQPTGTIDYVQDSLEEELCGIMDDCHPDGTPIFCNGDLYPNDGKWTEKTSSDPYLNDAYSQARTRMMDYTVDPLCRRIKAHDALQAATLGMLIEPKLRTLTHDYAALAGDPSAPVVLKTTALMLKGEAHERLNEPDSAVVAYSTITASYPTSSDSMSAAWRIHNINAESSDSTYGLTYDASMSVWRERVLEDMRRRSGYTTPGPHKYGADGQQGIAGIPVETHLEQNVPNPFSEETQIGYALGQAAHVRLVVSDVTGRTISVLVDRAQEAGSYVIPLSAAGLTTGVYWCRLEVNGAVISRQMTVIR